MHTNERKVGQEQDTCMNDFIRVDEIRINCNFEIGRIKSLSIKEQLCTHTVAEVGTDIEPGSLNVASQQFSGQPLVIEIVKDGKRMLLFSGVIGIIHVNREADFDTMHITAYSLTWFMDLEQKSRSFQGDTSVLELMQKVCKEHSFSFWCSLEDKMTKAPFIQYRETDWELLVRLSTHLHVPVYAASAYENKGLYIGLQSYGAPVKLNTLNEKWSMDEERAKIESFDTKKAVYCEVITGQILHLGQSAWCHNEVLWPFKVDMILNHGMLYCTYKLAGIHYFTMPTSYNPYVRGTALEGTVLERMNEKIKIHLDIDKEQDIKRAYYYPWLPEHGNMVYCMPEEGGKIRLLITGEDERDAIGIQCVRQNGGICKETQIPDNRWFSTDQNKKLTLQPSVIELSSEDGRSKISFDDSIGNSLKSYENILIQAKGRVVMQGTKVKLNAPREITAIKRELGDPAVVNICHNLDAMGKKTTFRNLEELKIQRLSKGGRTYGGQKIISEETKAREEKRKKMQFELQKLFRKESEINSYELGASIVNVISAIPQGIEQDRISQIAIGFRPIAGRMKGE